MVNWQQINTVLLDMDGTLLDLHFDNYFWQVHLPQRYSEKHQIPVDQAYRDLMGMIDSKQGSLQWYCLDYWTQELGLDIVLLKREVDHLIQFRPHAEYFLQQLQQSQRKVYLVTNAHRGSLSLKLEKTTLAQYCDGLISAHDYGFAKEQQAFWYALQDALGFDKHCTLFIDDSISVLQSAQQFGIQHLLSIQQPDSQRPAREQLPFPAIDCLRQLIDQAD